MRTKKCLCSIVFFFFFFSLILVSAAGAITRIMPLGNSITKGGGSGETDTTIQISYRKALWDELLAAGYDVDFVGSLQAGQDTDPDFDPDHEGHAGWRDDEIASNIYDWLDLNPADIILLHIGTNGLDISPDDVEDILDEIDRYEDNYTAEITVILARIINRIDYVCPNSSTTTEFNDNVEDMAQDRIDDSENPDKIIIVDMECGAGFDYRGYNEGGDMWDLLHPYHFGEGYAKMADVWFTALQQILPNPDPCEGDFNGDGDVDGSDLAVFAANFGRTDCGVPTMCDGDFDNDGDVDGSDLAVFAADFGRTDCPL